MGPISMRNRSFDGVFMLSLCLLEFSVGVRAFVIRLSKISSFFSATARIVKYQYLQCISSLVKCISVFISELDYWVKQLIAAND